MSTVESELTLKFSMQAPGPITVELRRGTSPYALVESVNGTGGGDVAAVISFGNAADGVPYWVVVKSANSIDTWSATPVTFNSHAASYDFATAANGGNQIRPQGIPSFYQGDVNQDGVIFPNDVLADSPIVPTHLSTDVTGDNVVDLSDLSKT